MIYPIKCHIIINVAPFNSSTHEYALQIAYLGLYNYLCGCGFLCSLKTLSQDMTLVLWGLKLLLFHIIK